jgi:catechol 2,3-dioxygenase-like lactoylglutathione lyase family enzyme
MVTRLSHCFITVRDQDEALVFYRDLVGLEVRADLPIGSMRWLTVAAPGEPDGTEISLETPEGRPGDEAALSRVMAAGSLTAAIFQTADCDLVFDALSRAGCPVIQPPTDQRYGVRDCAVRDPSGNMVRFSQPLAR